MQVKGSTDIAKTSEAQVKLRSSSRPCTTASRASSRCCSAATCRTCPATPSGRSRRYTITGYTRRNTSMTFYTNRGNDRLELEEAPFTAEGIDTRLRRDVTCSAFKMDETAFLGSQIDDIYYTLFPEENATTASRQLSLGRKVGRILWGSGSNEP